MDETGHWNVCTECGKNSEIQDHVPGAEATEETPQLCELCGFVLADKLEHTHVFESDWEYDDENHWHTCVCDELSPAEPHVWDEGQEINKDEITYSCQECGAECVEEAPAPAVPWWVYLVLIVLVCSIAAVSVTLVIVLKRPKGKYHRR